MKSFTTIAATEGEQQQLQGVRPERQSGLLRRGRQAVRCQGHKTLPLRR
jgi:hypothetical protein